MCCMRAWCGAIKKGVKMRMLMRDAGRKLMLSAALLGLLAAGGIARAQEKVYFPSAEFANKFQMAKKTGKPLQIFGYLSMPAMPAEGKIPAIVIAHGSGGIEKKDTEFWAPYFNKLGFATLVVDSFTPRGVARTVEDQSLVSNAADTVDAFYALRFLASDPRFDPARIGMIGFSRGGMAANETATRTFRDNVLRDRKDLQFAFHIPLYPGCQNDLFVKNGGFDKTGAPMLFLMGSKDDYTPAAMCLEIIKGMQKEYPGIIDYRVYDGAHHGFDANLGVRYLGLGVTTRNCPLVQTDLATWSKHLYASGESLPAAKEKEFYKGCMTTGVSVGSNNTQYREMAVQDIEAFLKRIRMID